MPQDPNENKKTADQPTGAPAADATDQTTDTDPIVDDIQRSESDAELDAAFAPPRAAQEKRTVFQKYWDNKKWTLSVTLLLLVLIAAFAVPVSRYKLLGLVIKRSYTITLADSVTHTPVTNAAVAIDSRHVNSDATGKVAVPKLSVGKHTVTVTKQYYQAHKSTVFVGVKGKHESNLQLVATGRQVPLKVINKVTGLGVANAVVSVAGTSAKTGTDGTATVVLPADKQTVDAKVTADGYNAAAAKVQITSQSVPGNILQLVPSGRVYFLSNRSGKVDVVSTNYDGSDRQTILAGTGYEDLGAQLIPSPDQKYVALTTRRTNAVNGQGLYIVSTDSGKVQRTEQDSNTSVVPVSWSDDYFVYTVRDGAISNWQSGAIKLKSFNANGGQNITLDQSTGEGGSDSDYAYQDIPQPVNVVDGNVLYAKSWSAGYYSVYRLQGKSNAIMSVQANGSSKKTLRSLSLPSGAQYSYISQVLAGPHTVYFEVPTTASNDPGKGASFFKYGKGNLTQLNNFTYANFTDPKLNDGFIVQSPSGNRTLYEDTIDGKLVVSTADSNGENKQKIYSFSGDGYIKGWLNDNYILAVQNNNQLYVVPAQPSSTSKALLVSDFMAPRGH
jgi:hypothetical protein